MKNMSIWIALALWVLAAPATAQKLARSEPENGAIRVPVNLGEIRLHFDVDMTTTGWSFLVSSQGTFPPPRGDNRQPWVSPRCCRLRIGPLSPNTTYAIQLNSSHKTGFRSTGNQPLPVTTLVFTTSSDPAETAPQNPTTRDPEEFVTPGSRTPETPTKRVPGGPPAHSRPPSSRGAGRPSCPEGWSSFSNELLGLHAWVPPGYHVRMRGRSILSVEREDGVPRASFLVPLRPRGQTTAARLADNFIRFCARQDPNYRGQLVKGGDESRTWASFTTEMNGQQVEGRLLSILGAGGAMAYIIGICAPKGQLESAAPELSRIAQGFGFSRPGGAWAQYRTPGNNLTLDLPQGWTVNTTEGRVAKNEVDWEACDPNQPEARAFSITPKFCTQNLMNMPLYSMRGYKVATFQSPQQCVQTSIGQFIRGARVTSAKLDPTLTRICQQLHGQLSANLQALQAGRFDVAVYQCQAQAAGRGEPVKIKFYCAISQLVMPGGFAGQSVQTDVWCRGWCAPEGQFLSASPVLDRIQESMQYTQQYIMRVHKAEAYRAKKVKDTWDHMNKIDREMNRKHWDTQDAIAEMYHDNWRDMGGYVNEKTGRIEQIDSEHVVRNSSGEVVSREEVQEQGIPADQATVLRDAYSADYMRGVYGRIEFVDI